MGMTRVKGGTVRLGSCHTRTRKRAALVSPPRITRNFRCTIKGAAIKFRLTLFLQPNHGFGESFHGSGTSRPHEFLGAVALDAALEPARKLAKTLNQGLGAVGFCHSGLEIAQPSQICLTRLLAQGELGILQFPK